MLISLINPVIVTYRLSSASSTSSHEYLLWIATLSDYTYDRSDWNSKVRLAAYLPPYQCLLAKTLQLLSQHEYCCGVCSEAKDHVEQLSKIKSVLSCLFCVLLSWLSSIVATDIVCLHDVSLMYTLWKVLVKWKEGGAP
jgi:hypothetical protein